jgi:hypothetical protein
MSFGEGSREYDGWVMTGIAAQQAMCGSMRYRDEATTLSATCHAASSELHGRNRPVRPRWVPDTGTDGRLQVVI